MDAQQRRLYIQSVAPLVTESHLYPDTMVVDGVRASGSRCRCSSPMAKPKRFWYLEISSGDAHGHSVSR